MYKLELKFDTFISIYVKRTTNRLFDTVNLGSWYLSTKEDDSKNGRRELRKHPPLTLTMSLVNGISTFTLGGVSSVSWRSFPSQIIYRSERIEERLNIDEGRKVCASVSKGLDPNFLS